MLRIRKATERGHADHGWLQLARGSVVMNGRPLEQGDGAAVSDEGQFIVTGKEKAEVSLFDLAW